MGDGSDDPDQIEELFSLIERGVSVAVLQDILEVAIC